MKKLTKKQTDKAIQFLNNAPDLDMYWDYREQLSDEQCEKIIHGRRDEVEEELWNCCQDHVFDLEKQRIHEALENQGLDPEDYQDYELRDALIDFISIDLNIKDLIRNTSKPNLRITLFSNYDCINSNWFEQSNGGYTYKESYFGAMVDALNFNPAIVKKVFEKRGMKMPGRWPNKTRRNGKEWVDYNGFAVDMENQSCPACNLVIVGKCDLLSFWERKDPDKPVKLYLPQGNYVGMFSHMNGGGSPIECPLKFALEIDLAKATGNTDYDHWGIEVDYGSYSIDNAYGVTKEFWKKEIICLK